MRIVCEFSDLNGTVLEGDVVAGQPIDDAGSFDLDSVFTLKTDEGEFFKVNGWLALVRVCEDGVGGCE
jgi:hypothetical protein